MITCVCVSGATADLRVQAWNTLTLAIDSGGPDAEDALGLLGMIEEQKARDLIDLTLKGKNGWAMAFVAKGLTAGQCRNYLPELKVAVLDPTIESKAELLAAIARANNVEATQILAAVGEKGIQPYSGIALGFLKQMGQLADNVLEKMATNGSSPSARETALVCLIRMRTHDAIPAFKAALHDEVQNVRVAGALGLARWGIADGKKELALASKSHDMSYQIEALVALAMLGQLEAFGNLSALVAGADETVTARVVWAIARSGNSTLKAFVYRRHLENNPVFREMLIERLLSTTNSHDLSLLEEAMSDKDDMCALIAAQKLLASGDNAHTQGAVTRGLNSTDERVRYLATQLASQYAVFWPELVKRVGDTNPTISAAAIWITARLNQREKFADLEHCFITGDRLVSLAAARALLSLDQKAAIEIFIKQLNTGSGYRKLYSSAMLLTIANGQLAILPSDALKGM